MARAHIVGAGLAGLAAAIRLSRHGFDISVYEAAGHAGGRCRSYFDEHLGIEIDNGNHLLLSGNVAAMEFLEQVGSRQTLFESPRAVFPFVDLSANINWQVRPNGGPIPWWILSAKRRVPGSSVGDYLRALRLRNIDSQTTVTEIFDPQTPVFRRFWEPLTVAVLNTRPEEAAASLLWPVLRETFGRGEKACRACIAETGLSNSFARPAVSMLTGRGVDVRFNARLREIDLNAKRCGALRFVNQDVPVAADDRIILAVPPRVAASLLPSLTVPTESRPIANAHFRLNSGGISLGALPFLGIIGGTAEWLFVRGNIVSVTVSAAEDVIDLESERLAALLWNDVARALDLCVTTVPDHRIVKEKRATFAQTPANIGRRPGPKTPFANLFLAGDWTDTGLPATIEGSIRSGNTAADVIVGNSP